MLKYKGWYVALGVALLVGAPIISSALSYANTTDEGELVALWALNTDVLNGQSLNGIMMNGIMMNGIMMNGIMMNGTGLSTTTVSPNSHANLSVEGGQLVIHAAQ